MLFNGGALNGRRLLKPSTVALMSRNHTGNLFEHAFLPLTAGMGFGLGVGITLNTSVQTWGRGRGAFGWGGAYGTESWVDPELGLTAAFFVQQPVREALVDYQQAIRNAVST
jgi:CubicO group peptidase (beta-lactamase class C family)